MTAELSTVRDGEGFSALASEWDALVLAMPRPSPFLLHGWLRAWWEHHGSGRDLRVHVARENGRLTGALPLYVHRRLGVRVAGFLGDDAAALADLLLAPGAEPSTAARLAARASDGADLVDVFGLPAASRLAASPPAGELTLIERAEAPVLDLAGGWEAVYAERTSAKRRSLHRRRWRQLGGLGEVTFEVARSPSELASALEEAFRLHAARWTDRPEASGFATDSGRRFHRAAIRALAPSGAPRIALLRVAGRAVACNYSFVLGDRMYFHELAFDPVVARWSPGQVTTLAAIEAAAADGVRRVEFLGGGERYKLELADRLEPLHQGIGLASTARGRAAAAARVASVRAHRRLKRTPVRRLYYEGLAPARRFARATRSATSARRGTSAPGPRPARTP
jgi:CelD/BcsL family acetyltransferase involved in cellulose biosynthesis